MDHGYGFYLDEYQRDVGVHTDDRRGHIECPDSAGFLAAHLPVFDLAAGSVAAFASAIHRSTRPGDGHWTLDPERIAASFSSDRLFRIGG
ncbi:MAG: hypothetical protein K0Q61_3257, partial [Rhodococcus erythropolis]|nr:hypothetical protein [Rhodococcus erythropolis]